MNEFHMHSKVDDSLFPFWSPHYACQILPASLRDLVCGAPLPSLRLGYLHILEPSDLPSTICLWPKKSVEKACGWQS